MPVRIVAHVETEASLPNAREAVAPFVHLMKTGGQTLRAVLRKNFGASHCDTFLREDSVPRDWKWMKVCYPRMKSICGHSVVPFDEGFRSFFPNARFHTILRDPIKRAISHYQFCTESGDVLPPFPEWMRENENYLARRISGESSAAKAIDMLEERVGFVGFVEHYNESLLMWRKWAGLPGFDLGYRIENKARSNTLKSEIESNDQYTELLEEYHVEDRKLFDYARNVIFQRQKDEYGAELALDCDEFEKVRKDAPDLRRVLTEYSGRLKRNCIYRVGIRKVGKKPKVSGFDPA